jgi:PDZ domain-containing protein
VLGHPLPVDGLEIYGVAHDTPASAASLQTGDELSPTDLAAGRHIAGTGTIDADGNVGEIGGIQAKARAALAAGAQLFLAPASQAADARAVLGTKVPVVGVTTFADALTALQAPPSSGL